MGMSSKYDPYRRHYKKDTTFLLDLYTLTYDSGETLSSLDVKVGTVLHSELSQTVGVRLQEESRTHSHLLIHSANSYFPN